MNPFEQLQRLYDSEINFTIESQWDAGFVGSWETFSTALLPKPECQWLKVKNPRYSQLLGRDDLFTLGEKKQPQPDWAGCVVACAEAEL